MKRGKRVEAVMAGFCGLRRRRRRFGDWGLWVKAAAAFWWLGFVSSRLFYGRVWLCKVGGCDGWRSILGLKL